MKTQRLTLLQKVRSVTRYWFEGCFDRRLSSLGLKNSNPKSFGKHALSGAENANAVLKAQKPGAEKPAKARFGGKVSLAFQKSSIFLFLSFFLFIRRRLGTCQQGQEEGRRWLYSGKRG